MINDQFGPGGIEVDLTFAEVQAATQARSGDVVRIVLPASWLKNEARHGDIAAEIYCGYVRARQPGPEVLGGDGPSTRLVDVIRERFRAAAVSPPLPTGVGDTDRLNVSRLPAEPPPQPRALRVTERAVEAMDPKEARTAGGSEAPVSPPALNLLPADAPSGPPASVAWFGKTYFLYAALAFLAGLPAVLLGATTLAQWVRKARTHAARWCSVRRRH